MELDLNLTEYFNDSALEEEDVKTLAQSLLPFTIGESFTYFI